MNHIKGNTYYYNSVVCQGAYKIDNDILLIDTGIDGSSVKKSIKDFNDINIKYIFNTHSHADHCGGNYYTQNKYSSEIICPSIEASFIENPILEPAYLYGAYPLKEMENKFLLAKPSKVTNVINGIKYINLTFNNSSYPFTLINLKGHSPNMHGIITPDNIAFIGDALLSKEYIDKHKLIFTYDVTEHIKSIELLNSIKADAFVLSHGGFYKDVSNLISLNKEALVNISNAIYNLISDSVKSLEDIHASLCKQFNINENISQHYLNESVIKAHLKYLSDQGKVSLSIDSGKLVISLL